MIFEVLTLSFLMIFSCFWDYFPSWFWLNFGIGFGKHLGSFWNLLLIFLDAKGCQNGNKKRNGNYDKKKYVPKRPGSNPDTPAWVPGGGKGGR
jgi:hypothetical protein